MVTSPGCISASLLMTAGIDNPLTQTRNKWRLKEMRWKDFPPRAALQTSGVSFLKCLYRTDVNVKASAGWSLVGWNQRWLFSQITPRLLDKTSALKGTQLSGADVFTSATDLRSSNTFKVKTHGPEPKEPSQQSRRNAIETRQCLSTSKTSAQLFPLCVPCGKLVLIKQLLLERSTPKNWWWQIFTGPGGLLLMATIDLAPVWRRRIKPIRYQEFWSFRREAQRLFLQQQKSLCRSVKRAFEALAVSAPTFATAAPWNCPSSVAWRQRGQQELISAPWWLLGLELWSFTKRSRFSCPLGLEQHLLFSFYTALHVFLFLPKSSVLNTNTWSSGTGLCWERWEIGRWTEELSGLAQKPLIQHVGFVPICWGDYSLQQLKACPQMSLITEPLAADNAGKLRRQQLRCRGW